MTSVPSSGSTSTSTLEKNIARDGLRLRTSATTATQLRLAVARSRSGAPSEDVRLLSQRVQAHRSEPQASPRVPSPWPLVLLHILRDRKRWRGDIPDLRPPVNVIVVRVSVDCTASGARAIVGPVLSRLGGTCILRLAGARCAGERPPIVAACSSSSTRAASASSERSPCGRAMRVRATSIESRGSDDQRISAPSSPRMSSTRERRSVPKTAA